MTRTTLRVLMLLALVAVTPAAAQDDLKVVESVPAEIADVVSGGSWATNGDGGFYRAFVVMSGEGEEFGARIYLQWLSIGEDSPTPKILQTLPVAEINEQRLENAAIEIDGEDGRDNRITIVVRSYDFEKDQDILLLVEAEEPGKYSVKKATEAALGDPEED